MPTIKELQKTAHTQRRDIMYRFIGYLAYFPAKILIPTPITPNQLTIIWIIGQLGSALLLLAENQAIKILGLVLFQAFFILDCSDGIIARYKKKFSLNGIYLDRVGHYLANSFLLVCYTWSVFTTYDQPLFVAIGGLAILTFLLNKAITLNPAWYPSQQREFITQSSEKSLLKNQPSLIYHIFALFRLEYFLNIMFWGTLLGFMQYTLMLYALFFTLELGRKLINQFRLNRTYDEKALGSNTNDFFH